MEVAVRELKAKLSAYLREARAGQTIIVTDRGRPVAVLGPPYGPVDLEAAIDAGWVMPATAPGPLPQVAPRRARASVAHVLVEDRGE